jgi:mono/diheme cytochrome c family protein
LTVSLGGNQQPCSRIRSLLLLNMAALVLSCSGCDVPIDAFEPNRLLAKRLELTEKIDLEPVRTDVARILEELFGTPDVPSWPEFLAGDSDLSNLVSGERLQRAAGAVRSDQQGTHYGLYREHCILCHGIAGNGLGATSRLLNPYPRDFRLGKFKFKSTPIGSRPTRADLARTLAAGIPGTSMPSFRLLPDEDLQALIDYTIYLSIRGEVERGLLLRAAYELDLDADEPLLDFEIRQSDPQEFQTQWTEIQALVTQVASRWKQGEEMQLRPPSPPANVPVVGQELTTPDAQQRLAASIERGGELFVGKVANCASCHGTTGAGDGVVNDYDDWTKDWTTAAGLDPQDRTQLRPLLKAGGLRPRHIQPRDLRMGVYRGGSSPQDLYLRIVHGIEGTPMPAAPRQPEISVGLSESDIWDLINFLLNLPHPSASSVPNTAAGSPS